MGFCRPRLFPLPNTVQTKPWDWAQNETFIHFNTSVVFWRPKFFVPEQTEDPCVQEAFAEPQDYKGQGARISLCYWVPILTVVLEGPGSFPLGIQQKIPVFTKPLWKSFAPVAQYLLWCLSVWGPFHWVSSLFSQSPYENLC